MANKYSITMGEEFSWNVVHVADKCLIINCSFHHVLHSLHERKNGLMERYQFSCKCEACLNNFPLFEHLSECDKGFDEFIDSDLDQLEEFSAEDAGKAILKYSGYINKQMKHFPCYEICLLQECILRCFRTLEKFQSKSNSKLIEC